MARHVLLLKYLYFKHLFHFLFLQNSSLCFVSLFHCYFLTKQQITNISSHINNIINKCIVNEKKLQSLRRIFCSYLISISYKYPYYNYLICLDSSIEKHHYQLEGDSSSSFRFLFEFDFANSIMTCFISSGDS